MPPFIIFILEVHGWIPQRERTFWCNRCSALLGDTLQRVKTKFISKVLTSPFEFSRLDLGVASLVGSSTSEEVNDILFSSFMRGYLFGLPLSLGYSSVLNFPTIRVVLVSLMH